MAKTRGTGLLMLWTDVDPEHEAEFNRWYNEEHIQHLLRVPGFLSAGRYAALSGGPKYLAMYELEEPSVLRTQAFLDEVRFRPSPWRTKTSGGHVGRNYMLQAYRQIHPARTDPIDLTMGPSPYLLNPCGATRVGAACVRSAPCSWRCPWPDVPPPGR